MVVTVSKNAHEIKKEFHTEVSLVVLGVVFDSGVWRLVDEVPIVEELASDEVRGGGPG